MVRRIWPEELFERGMQVIGEPRLRPRKLQIADGLIDLERGIPCHVRRHHRVQHFQQPVPVCLAPQAARVAKTIRFVVVVVAPAESSVRRYRAPHRGYRTNARCWWFRT